jgi:molybdopterin-guanine dinucleotide biosynthesis protein A
MGQDKALVQLDGIALASRMAHTMSQAGCTQVTLVGRQTYLADLGWPALSETEAGHHPLFGVAAALDSIEDGLAIFSPCDLIHLQVSSVRHLLDHGSPCVAESPQGLHPLLLVIPTSMAHRARELAVAGAPVQDLVQTLPRLALTDAELFDANQPVDLLVPPE